MPDRKTRPQHPSPDIRRINLGYTTPEWLYAVDDLSPFVTASISVAVYAAWLPLVWSNPFGWIISKQMIAAILGIAAA